MSELIGYNRAGHGIDMTQSSAGVGFLAPGGDYNATLWENLAFAGDVRIASYETVEGVEDSFLETYFAPEDAGADPDYDIESMALYDQSIYQPEARVLFDWSALDVQIEPALLEEPTAAWPFDGFAGADRIQGNMYRDVVKAGASADVVIGRGGADRLHGESGEDRLYGGDEPDRLSGGAGADFFDGGGGADRLTGGPDADQFYFRSRGDAGRGDDRDVIVDFTSGEDLIRLEGIDADADRRGNQAFTFVGAARYDGEPGTLRLSGGVLGGDVDGDSRSDFQIELARGDELLVSDISL